MDEECLCICCNLDGFEGCPKSDAQENEMALKKENKKLKEQQLTEDELLFIITPKGLPPLPKHIRLAKKIIAKMKEKAE